MKQTDFEFSTDEKAWDPKDILERPFIDLIESPIECFAPMLRGETLPSDEVFSRLYGILLQRVALMLLRKSDVAALEADLDDLRRLIPHSRRDEINARPIMLLPQWAERIDALGDLMNAAIEIVEARLTAERDMRLLEGKKILKKLAESDGKIESELSFAESLKMERSQCRRILALLEGAGLVQREPIGRDKRVFLTEAGKDFIEKNDLSR
ncbi:MAG: hypothetical protein HYS44_00725 [Candidatus Niyogibacteria bacterium]|nr:hypothetical protein [Candidatus Niyogibacteria bacterium]